MLSLVIPVFNARSTLQACLDSCFAQTYQAMEIIVIDGGSTDGSITLIEACQARLAFWATAPDGGIYDAWNKGLRQASGEWIAFMGADDAWSAPTSVEKLMSLACFPAVNLVTARLQKLAHAGVGAENFGEPWSTRGMRSRMIVAHAGMPHHRSLFDKFGPFDTDFKIAGDYDFLLRAATEIRAAHLNETVAQMGGGGVSSTQLARVRDESARALRTAPVAGPLWALSFWLRFNLRHWQRLRSSHAGS